MIIDNIDNLIKEAMKAKESEKLSALRMLKTKLVTAKSSGKEYNDNTELDVLNQYIKQINQSMNAYQNVSDLKSYHDCESEMLIIMSFMPKMLTKDEIFQFINNTYESDKDVMFIRQHIFKDLKGKAQSSDINSVLSSIK